MENQKVGYWRGYVTLFAIFLTLQVPTVSNINFLLTISIQCQEIRLWELIKWSPKRKYFDLLSNSLNLFFKEMYRDQCGEVACGYWGLKGYKAKTFHASIEFRK